MTDRERVGREASPSAAILDSQSVRTADQKGSRKAMTPLRRSPTRLFHVRPGVLDPFSTKMLPKSSISHIDCSNSVRSQAARYFPRGLTPATKKLAHMPHPRSWSRRPFSTAAVFQESSKERPPVLSATHRRMRSPGRRRERRFPEPGLHSANSPGLPKRAVIQKIHGQMVRCTTGA